MLRAALGGLQPLRLGLIVSTDTQCSVRWLPTALGALFAMQCGARTELVEPEEIAVERDRPVVMALMERAVSSAPSARCERDPRLAPDLSFSRWDATRDVMRAGLSAIDEAAEVGGLVYPKNGERMEGLQQDLSIYCRVDPGAAVPPSIGGVARVLQRVDAEGQPTGSQAVYEALRAGRRLLDTPAYAGRDRFIVLANFGAPNCNPRIAALPCACETETPENRCSQGDILGRTYGCFDTDRVEETLRAYRAEGIETIIVGLPCPLPSFAALINNLNRMAVAGGRPRAEGPYRFFLSTEVDAFRASMEALFLPLGMCRLRALRTPVPDDVAVQFQDGTPIPYDAAGRTGWRWTDRAAGKLALAGETCREVIRRRDTPRMLVPARNVSR